MNKTLLEKFASEQLSANQIADKLGISESTVRRALKKYDIKTFRYIDRDPNAKVKVCRYCKIEKNIEQYPIAGVLKGVTYFRNKCNECYVAMKKDRRNNLTQWLTEIKKNLFCSECKNNDFRVIQFHHEKDDKLLNVSDMLAKGFSKENILKEIDKCIPLCANCHIILHYEERQRSN